jgi:hypothetical protein
MMRTTIWRRSREIRRLVLFSGWGAFGHEAAEQDHEEAQGWLKGQVWSLDKRVAATFIETL